MEDEEYVKDLYDSLYDLIGRCVESKRNIKDMDDWEVVHDLEFRLELAFETLRRYLAKKEIDYEAGSQD